MLLKRALTHVLLAVALLVSQQAAFAHAATHLGKAPATQDKQLPHTKVCGQCVLGVQLGTALLDMAPPCSATWMPSLGYLADDASAHIPTLLPAFSSRAPPTLL